MAAGDGARPAAVTTTGSQGTLQAADRGGQGGLHDVLHDVEPCRGAGELPFLRDGNEVRQLAQTSDGGPECHALLSYRTC